MTSGSATSPLRLASATIRDVTAFQAELAERLDAGGPVQIDGSGVERVDTATLQLLATFVRDLRAEARAVEWIECSPALRRAAGSLGLESALSLSGQ
jgi:anti-anti-sigma regulatory factor